MTAIPAAKIDGSLFAEQRKPLALIVFLENVGHIVGLDLPQWAMNTIDYVTEEYAKLLLRIYGAYGIYDRVIILEDEQATGPELASALLGASTTHQVDLLLLVHGREGELVGFRGTHVVGDETFGLLRDLVHQDSSVLDLRMVYGLNCYGSSLTSTWLGLGAQVVNGAAGVNWLPEPSLSLFLWHWLRGHPYSVAVQISASRALQLGRRIWRPDPGGQDHEKIRTSRQLIAGVRDLTIHS